MNKKTLFLILSMATTNIFTSEQVSDTELIKQILHELKLSFDDFQLNLLASSCRTIEACLTQNPGGKNSEIFQGYPKDTQEKHLQKIAGFFALVDHREKFLTTWRGENDGSNQAYYSKLLKEIADKLEKYTTP
ncbi:MAG: hypothetical protein UR26_C0001G0139 [candidate division TM6 bacterium GW2011_GWF2_32_72]|nr:MAG: hypothetical protein UR26_C0001G0139 [candidate division TM6 bacterium GW2011_GWF2_32_72]